MESTLWFVESPRLPNGAAPQTGLPGVSVNAVLVNLMRAYQPVCTRKRLAVGLDLDPGEPRAALDETSVARTLANMLDAAIQQSPSGGLLVCRTAVRPYGVALTVAHTARAAG
jgi:signal transduction histidine kinase